MNAEYISYKDYLVESDWNEFEQTVNVIIENYNETGKLNEGLLNNLSKKLKNGIDFIKQFAQLVNGKFIDVLKLFKEKIIFAFFSKIKWSISALINTIKKGYKLWHELHSIIAKYIADTGIVNFSAKHLKDLDTYLAKKPLIKKAGALVIAGFLIYQWTQMISFTGDIEFDFDQSVLFDAIKGNYSLVDLFSTESGVKMLMFIVTGVLTGISFPWPGNAWVLFAFSLVYTVAKHKHPQLAKTILSNAKKFKNITS